LIEITDVKRVDGRARQVTIDIGNVGITYVLGQNGQPREIGRSSQSQTLDDQSLIVSLADYRQAVKTAGAILREKR